MKVTALRAGFFDGTLIAEGQEFEVPTGTKGSWFVALDGVKAPIKAKAPAKAEAKTLSEIAKAPATAATDIA